MLLALKNRLRIISVKGYLFRFANFSLLDIVDVAILSTAVDNLKEEMTKILLLFLSDQGWMLIII